MEPEIDLDYELLKMTLSLYNNPFIPRKIVQFFMDTLIFFIYEIFLKSIICHLKNLNVDPKVLADIDRVAQAASEIFENYSTEDKRLDTYKSKGLITEPKKLEIDPNNNVFGYTGCFWANILYGYTSALALENP